MGYEDYHGTVKGLVMCPIQTDQDTSFITFSNLDLYVNMPIFTCGRKISNSNGKILLFFFFLFLVKIRSENCIIHKRPLKVVLYPWLKRKSRAFTVLKKCTFGFTLISEILSDGL